MYFLWFSVSAWNEILDYKKDMSASSVSIKFFHKIFKIIIKKIFLYVLSTNIKF